MSGMRGNPILRPSFEVTSKLSLKTWPSWSHFVGSGNACQVLQVHQ
jgi:hypothetical protein